MLKQQSKVVFYVNNVEPTTIYFHCNTSRSLIRPADEWTAIIICGYAFANRKSAELRSREDVFATIVLGTATTVLSPSPTCVYAVADRCRFQAPGRSFVSGMNVRNGDVKAKKRRLMTQKADKRRNRPNRFWGRSTFASSKRHGLLPRPEATNGVSSTF